MGIETAIFGAVAAAGLATQIVGMKKMEKAGERQNVAYAQQAAASRRASEASKRAEDAREEQMRLDAARSRRQAIREAQAARSLSVVRQSAAGASVLGGSRSSAYGGAQSQIGADLGRGLQGIYQNESIGARIFAANRDIYTAQAQGANWGSVANQAGVDISRAQGLVSIGQQITSAAPAIGRIGTSLFPLQGYGGQSAWETQVLNSSGQTIFKI